MKLYRLTLQPLSGLGTPLKGDTLFGQFCWQVAHDPTLLKGGLEANLETYAERPFIVFSSAYPLIKVGNQEYLALKRPDLPQSLLFPFAGRDRLHRLLERKDNIKKKWMLVPLDLSLDLSRVEYKRDGDLVAELSQVAEDTTKRLLRKNPDQQVIITWAQPHNSIHRITGSTGTAAFAPYNQTRYQYFPDINLAILVLLDKEVTDIEKVGKALTRIGAWGFGRDASIGQGRFKLVSHGEIPIPATEHANAFYTLAPSVPAPGSYQKAFFTPFIRFGKHGDIYARSRNPFKKPVIMADEGAVFISRENALLKRPYVGQAVTGISEALSKTTMQGYSPYIPLRLEI